jgi:hypothetical protein
MKTPIPYEAMLRRLLARGTATNFPDHAARWHAQLGRKFNWRINVGAKPQYIGPIPGREGEPRPDGKLRPPPGVQPHTKKS